MKQHRYPWLCLLVLNGTFGQNLAFSQSYAFSLSPPEGNAVQSGQGRALRTALRELETKFNVYFNFDEGDVREKTVKDSLQASDTLEESLRKLLGPLQLNYEKVGEKYYTIFGQHSRKLPRKKQRSADVESPRPAARWATFPADETNPATGGENAALTITGKVTADNEGIPGRTY